MPEDTDPPRIVIQVIQLRGRRDLVHELRGEYAPGLTIVELSGQSGHLPAADPPAS